MPDITISDLHFSYSEETPVLNGIDLHIPQGQFLCILGANGSGKSSLVRHINGLLQPSAGRVGVGDLDTQSTHDLQKIRSLVGMVFQNPDDQLVASIIENEVAFGPENLGLEHAEIQERVSSALAEVGLIGFDKKETNALSGGQKQRLALAGALAMRPQVLILDEASSMLDPRGRESLLQVCHELHNRGITLIMVTHFMDEAAQADRIVVLDQGKIQMDGTPLQVLSQTQRIEALHLQTPLALEFSQLVRTRCADFPLCLGLSQFAEELTERIRALGVALDLAPSHPLGTAPASDGLDLAETGTAGAIPCPNELPAQTSHAFCASQGAVQAGSSLETHPKELLTLKDVSYAYDKRFAKAADKRRKHKDATLPNWGSNPNAGWALEGVSFSVYEHEFLGIAGHTGSGKSTLLQLLNGLLRPSRGQVLFCGQDISSPAHAREALRGVGLVFQYPEHQLFAPTVYEDVAFGPKNLGLSSTEIQTRVQEALARVNLDYERFAQSNPFELSGGQQRRVAFAGILAMQPKILVLDEPTCGLDPRAKQVFLDLIHSLHAQGLTIVMVSHNMDDLSQHAERMIVLDKGKLLCEGKPAEVFLQHQLLYKHGLNLPSSQRLAQLFSEQAFKTGLDLPFEPEKQFYSAHKIAQFVEAAAQALGNKDAYAGE